jgi:DNA invertase Pin-like site-specific DNA recombinase
VKLKEERGVRARYIAGDMPDSPQGQLLRDLQLSVAKFYLGNLREEVKKSLAEKAAQAGRNGRAPLGYVNDREARKIPPDPLRGPLVRHAFERYASGLLSLSDLANELHAMGLSHVRSGNRDPDGASGLGCCRSWPGSSPVLWRLFGGPATRPWPGTFQRHLEAAGNS